MSCFYSKEFSNSSITDVENQFIYQFMPKASGDAVKVYLYGLFLCKNSQYEQTLADISGAVGISEDEVISCFKFWEEFGLVSVISTSPLSVEYFPVKNASFNKPKKYKPEKYAEFTKAIQQALSARMISTNEYSEYFNIMETYGINPEAMLMIVKYCVSLKGDDIGYKYISKVAKDFGNRGITTIDNVEKELSSFFLKTAEIERIFKALSVKRKPEIDDINYFKKWTGDLGFESENIVFIASIVKKGGMTKLDQNINELFTNKCFSKEEIKNFFDKKQAIFDLAIKINKALCVYEEVMETVIDTYTNKWLSYGFSDDALLFIASYCFKNDKKSLKQMDELVEQLRLSGFISLTSVSDYFDDLVKTDLFIAKMLETAGINRRPNSWDRENVNIWKGWNFTEEMILEASSLSAGKSSPIAYMNGILSNWKNAGIFEPKNIDKSSFSKPDNSALEYNREYEKRRSKAISIAQKNTDMAMEIDGFPSIYERVFSIEKDLAFAEISGQKDKLKLLENEKTDVLKKVSELLAKINLTIDDLSPKFACKKCNDTGYVGTQRCDCL